MSIAELQFGVLVAPDEQRRAHRLARLSPILRGFEPLPVDAAVATSYVLYQDHPELIPVWQSFRDARARSRAVARLAEQGLVGDDAARQFTVDHPEPDLP